MSDGSHIGPDHWRFNGPNPIVGYTVGIEFEKALTPPTLRRISGLHGQIKRELPRRSEQQAVTIQMGGFPQTPAHAELSGVVFDRLKPDGNPQHALSVGQAVATYMTSEYTRWVEFWPVADRLLRAVGNIALVEAAVRAVLLVANNRFEWAGTSSDVDVSSLLRKEPRYVAQHVLDCADPCHSLHGYVVDNPNPPGKRTDNVIYVVGSQPDGAKFLDLNFSFRLELTDTVAGSEALFGASMEEPKSFLGTALQSLHDLNKGLLRDIILQSVVTSIPGLALTC